MKIDLQSNKETKARFMQLADRGERGYSGHGDTMDICKFPSI